MRKSALYAAVSHLKAFHQIVLPALADIHRILQEIHVERTQFRILHQSAPALNDPGLLLLIFDGKPSLFLIRGD